MDKLISYNAAIEAFGLSEKTRKYGGDHSGYDTRMLYEIQDTLENLPPAKDDRLVMIADLVRGTINHFDLDDAMDLLYEIKRIVRDV